MLEVLKKLLFDEAYFTGAMRAVIFLLGQMIQAGTIPTGVEGLGATVGPFISAAALVLVAKPKATPAP